MTVGITDKHRNKLVNKEDVNKRWAENFKELLNIVDDGVANISAVGNGRIHVCQRCDVEINGTVRRLK